ncbi:MAG: hypothetical protein UHE91_08320 [Bacteroidales bacterium]|nr:hypothetical protein [Bacteroidales bacterium]
MNDNKNDKTVSLEDMYKKMMNTIHSTSPDFSKWEKSGDIYKQYSIYDTSKYETILSSNTIINK